MTDESGKRLSPLQKFHAGKITLDEAVSEAEMIYEQIRDSWEEVIITGISVSKHYYDNGITFEEAVDECNTAFNLFIDFMGFNLFSGKGQREFCMSIASIGILHEINQNYEFESNKFEILRYAFARNIRDGIPIHSQYRDLAAAMMIGRDENIIPRKQDGQIPALFRKAIVVYMIEFLVSCGMKATRNSATKQENSACDAVAKALSMIGYSGEIPRTYGAVLDIWKSRKEINSAMQHKWGEEI